MAKRKRSDILNTKALEAEAITRGIIRRRKHLNDLMRLIKAHGDPSGEKTAQARALVDEIERKKKALRDRGIDPLAATRWIKSGNKVKVERMKKKRGQGAKVGAYGLGPSLKFWK